MNIEDLRVLRQGIVTLCFNMTEGDWMKMWPSNMQLLDSADGRRPSPSEIMECPGWMCPWSPEELLTHSVDEVSIA